MSSFDLYLNFTGIPRKYHEGVLLGYMVYFADSETIDPCIKQQPFETCSAYMRNLTVNVTEIKLEAEEKDIALLGLETSVLYTMCVRAFTAVGEGPVSKCMRRSTDNASTFRCCCY